MIWESTFDDVSVGDAFVTRGRTVTEADVVAFAGLTGDWHPQHADAVQDDRLACRASVEVLWRRDAEVGSLPVAV